VQLFVGVKSSINCSSQISYLGLYSELIFLKYYIYTDLEQFIHVPWYVLDVYVMCKT